MDRLINIIVGWSLYDILCIGLFLILSLKLKVKSSNNLIIIVCIFGMAIAILGNGITMDYRAYWKIIQQVVYGSNRYIHLEPIYKWLIHHIGANYILWQSIIYIPSYIFFYHIVKKLAPDRLVLFLLCFSLFVLYHYCIGSRQFLFVSTYSLGLIMLWQKKYAKGILLLVFSAFLHKMAMIAFPLALLLFIKIENKLRFYIVLTLIAIIIARILFIPLIEFINLISGVGENSSYTNNNIKEISSGSIWWQIINKYSKWFITSTLWLVLYKTRNILKVGSKVQKNIYGLTFWSTLASIFFSNIGLVDLTIASRFSTLGIIGFCYLLSVMPDITKIKYNLKLLFFVGILIYFILLNAFIKGVTNSTLLGDLPLE